MNCFAATVQNAHKILRSSQSCLEQYVNQWTSTNVMTNVMVLST